MILTTQSVRRSVLTRQLVFSLGVALVLAWFGPVVLLLDDALQSEATRTLFIAGVLAGGVAAIRTSVELQRHAPTIEALLEPGPLRIRVSTREIRGLGRASGGLSWWWMVPHWLSLAVFATPLRPPLMDFTTGVTLALIGSLIVAAASLPLHASLRSVFLQLLELAPRDVMLRVLRASEAETRGRVNRRLVAAVATPIIFVSVGCALIANAHIRRADERATESMARKLAKAAFEVEHNLSVKNALQTASELGFVSTLSNQELPYSVSLKDDGYFELVTPVDGGSVIVNFQGSKVSVPSAESLLLASIAVIIAALAGYLLGSALTQDLVRSTRQVQILGAEAILGGSTLIERPARFKMVSELQAGIDRLADRFRTFAEAQQSAIDAREAATRMRGLFFASVSHDLRSPLNSILGFTELVRADPLTDGQKESLEVIQKRGRELLALIETILDAARVEAAQLSLLLEVEPFADLYQAVLKHARELSADYPIQVFDDIQQDLPPVMIDKRRVSQAIATFITYSVRATKGGKMWIRAEMDSPHELRIDVDVPTRLHSHEALSAMVGPSGATPEQEYRGMALALRLARSVIELHSGRVRIVDRGQKGAMFCITLPTAQPGRLPTPEEMATRRISQVPRPPGEQARPRRDRSKKTL